MTGWTIALMFQAMITTAPDMTYAQAYQQSVKTGKPLVILVGAEWCGACRNTKRTTISQLKREGAMKGVVYVSLDTDKHSGVTSKLMRGRTVPQMIIFHKDESGWHKQHMVGLLNENTVRSAMATAKQASVAPRQAALRPPLETM